MLEFKPPGPQPRDRRRAATAALAVSSASSTVSPTAPPPRRRRAVDAVGLDDSSLTRAGLGHALEATRVVEAAVGLTLAGGSMFDET